jgi:hypothetical protein
LNKDSFWKEWFKANEIEKHILMQQLSTPPLANSHSLIISYFNDLEEATRQDILKQVLEWLESLEERAFIMQQEKTFMNGVLIPRFKRQFMKEKFGVKE